MKSTRAASCRGSSRHCRAGRVPVGRSGDTQSQRKLLRSADRALASRPWPFGVRWGHCETAHGRTRLHIRIFGRRKHRRRAANHNDQRRDLRRHRTWLLRHRSAFRGRMQRQAQLRRCVQRPLKRLRRSRSAPTEKLLGLVHLQRTARTAAAARLQRPQKAAPPALPVKRLKPRSSMTAPLIVEGLASAAVTAAAGRPQACCRIPRPGALVRPDLFPRRSSRPDRGVRRRTAFSTAPWLSDRP